MSAQEWRILGIVLCVCAVLLLVVSQLALRAWYKKKLQD